MLVIVVLPFSHKTVAVGIPYPTHVSRIVVGTDIIAFDVSKTIPAGSVMLLCVKKIPVLSNTITILLGSHQIHCCIKES